MGISTIFFAFLDIAPPKQIGTVGYASAIGFGLLFVSLGIICIRLLKKWLPAWLRLGIGGFLLFFGIAGGVSMAISVAEHDAEARQYRPNNRRITPKDEER